MNGLADKCELSISALLERGAGRVREAGHDRWKFELAGAVALSVAARRSREWLMFRAPLARSTKRLAPDLLDRLLAQNAELPGGAKFTLADDPPRLCVSAEIPLADEDADLGLRIAEVCEAFRQAAQTFAAGARPGDADPDVPIAGDEAPPVAIDPRTLDLCEQAGWPLVRRAGEEVAIELDVPGSFCQALAQAQGDGGFRLAVELATVPATVNAGRNAINVFLLHASHVVRMARATSRTANGSTAFGWEVALDRVAGAGEVQHALSALSVACRLTAGEIQLFEEDESTARAYLTLRGWCS